MTEHLIYDKIDWRDIVLKKIPEFKDIIEEHLKDNGEILSYLLFGDMARYFIENFEKDNTSLLYKIVSLIDELYVRGDNKIQELIMFGFLENIDPNLFKNSQFEKLFTPKLLACVKEINSFWSGK